ncbi:hypothetical protein BB559_005823 [Furculomyces boomerangus]|uniref:Actin-related protein 4 n=1 Tax=Furculomyces boomerangus TaxID=61424 RepID=A0A2T9Y6E5_9FUNG|nr:hypothetical protein BB559_005823 [Furculomyces boomerangus]
MPTYNGDEVNALVLDVGSMWTRAGFAGEESPYAYFPTSVGYMIDSDSESSKNNKKAPEQNPTIESNNENAEKNDSMDVDTETNKNEKSTNDSEKSDTRLKYYVGNSGISLFRPGMEVKNVLADGMVDDWDAYEKILDYALYNQLRINPEEHPIMVSEASWNSAEKREKLTELMFEKFKCPGFYVCKSAVLTAFGTGKSTALVVDSGADFSSAVPVYDGYVLQKGIVRQNLGGNVISDLIVDYLKEEQNYQITPLFEIKRKERVEVGKQPIFDRRDLGGITDSFRNYMIRQTVLEYKESVCQVLEYPYDENTASSRGNKSFEFPDGFSLVLGSRRFYEPEVMFQPNLFFNKDRTRIGKNLENMNTDKNDENINGNQNMNNNTNLERKKDAHEYMSIQELAYRAVSKCDVDLRPHLLHNVVLTGGNTLFPGFTERFSNELPKLCQSSRVRIHTPGSTIDRRYTAWLGGSILASLGTFHQMWISSEEYQEQGTSIVNKRCF